MTLREFHNALRILRSIDRSELLAEGIEFDDDPRPGHAMREERAWNAFRDNPYETLIHCSDSAAEGLWRIISRRQA